MTARRWIPSSEGVTPLSHYSPAIVLDHTVYCSGSLGTDPCSGELVDGGIEGQTRQALLNLEAVLKMANSDLENVVQMTCFLTRASDFAGFDRIYRELVPTPPPTRATVAAELMVEGALVEIQAIAAATKEPSAGRPG